MSCQKGIFKQTMKKTDFAGLSRLDIDLRIFGAARISFPESSTVRSFMSTGRRCDLLYYMISGEREYYSEDRLIAILKPGEAIFLPTGTTYYSKVISKGSDGIYIDFSLEENGEPLMIDEPFYVISGEWSFGYFEAIVENRLDRLRVRAELYRLLSKLSSQAASSDLNDLERRVGRAVSDISRHPELPISVSRLARECCISETGFRQTFKALSGGSSPTAFRNRARIERADELLATGEFSVAQITELLGFYDTAHFYRIYRRLRGHPPIK